MGNKCKCMRLSAVSLGLAFGIISGLCMMIFAWAAWIWGYGAAMMQLSANMHPGLDASLQGGFFGLAWGFIEGFVIGVIFGWLYNMCLCCCASCGCCCCKSKDSTCRTTM